MIRDDGYNSKIEYWICPICNQQVLKGEDCKACKIKEPKIADVLDEDLFFIPQSYPEGEETSEFDSDSLEFPFDDIALKALLEQKGEYRDVS